MEQRVVSIDDDEIIDWVSEPVFAFVEEVDALLMLQRLGDEVDSARKQLSHAMRYMKAAVVATRQLTEDGSPVSKEAIISHSGLSRRTVYQWLDAAGVK